MNEETDKLERSSATPNLEALHEEWARCFEDSEYIYRLENSDDVRFARWPGKTNDGLKHQSAYGSKVKVRPWDKCSDVEERLADDTINSLVDLHVSSFWNARLRAQPATLTKLTATQAAELRTVISAVVHGGGRADLVRVVERAAQLEFSYGLCVLGIAWRRERQIRLRPVTLKDAVAIAAKAAQQPGAVPGALEQLPEIVLDEAREDEAVALFEVFFPEVRKTKARQCIRELRETGETEVPVPEVVVDRPEVRALMPFRDIFWPPETSTLESARVLFERRFLSAQELESMAASQDWDRGFVEAAKATLGQGTSQDAVVGYATVESDTRENLIEVVWAYARQLDADGVEGIWVTGFSPNVPDKYGYHELLDYAHGRYPFVALQAEYAGDRVVDSRGVPDQCQVQQSEIKWWRDQVRNHLAISIGPPIFGRVVKGMAPPDISPFSYNPVAGDFQWKWMEAPGGQPQMGLSVAEMLWQRNADYFGLPRPEGHTGKAQMRQQRLVNNWLMTWAEAFWQMSVLAYQYWGPGIEALLGRPPALTAEIVRRQQLALWFDVRSLEADWVLQLVQALNQFVLPLDAAGIVDRAKLVHVVLSYFEPTLADEITMQQEPASQMLFNKTRDEVLQMAAGNEGQYVENAPTAGMELKFAEQIIASNPKYVELLRSDPRFQELMKKWAENRKQSVVQEMNKTVGRLGVTPG